MNSEVSMDYMSILMNTISPGKIFQLERRNITEIFCGDSKDSNKNKTRWKYYSHLHYLTTKCQPWVLVQNGTEELKEQRTELLKKEHRIWAYTVKNSDREEIMDDLSIPQSFRARKWLEITLNKAETHAKDRSAYKEAQQSKIFYLHWSRSHRINEKVKLRYSNYFYYRENRGVTFYLPLHLWKTCSRTFRKINPDVWFLTLLENERSIIGVPFAWWHTAQMKPCKKQMK